MQYFIKHTILFTLLCLLAGCSNDFLNENLVPRSFPFATSNIYISPEWESTEYMFKLPSLKDAEYEIVSKPRWLNIESSTGQLSDSIAVIHCSAKENSSFSKIGIYEDFMTVKAAGKSYKIPVAYITEGNPTVQVQSSVSLSYSSYSSPSLPIHNTGEGILMWKISSMPDWLAIDTAKIVSTGLYISQNNSYSIPFVIKPGKTTIGNLTGTVVLLTNDKEHPSVIINVSANLGTPQLNIYTNTINFSSSETSKTLSFNNYGDGVLIWEFENIPAWLTLTPSSGMCSQYSSNNITFTCDRSKLSPGQNMAIINLKTNDRAHSSYSITVNAVAPGSNENIRAVDGNIVDAVFNKKTNTLFYVTGAPNKLIAYDVTTRSVLHEIALSKAPTCFAISEDWTKAAVGHNGSISAINLSGNTVTANYLVDYSVNDIAWGENDWFCYTQKGGSFSCLHWINTATGTLYDDTDKYSLDGSSVVKKVPDQPYIIATRNSTSPSGFFSYSVATRSKKSYSHMDLTNFWMSEDGLYVYAQNSNIYRTSSSTGSTDTFDADINAIGKINLGSSYGINFICHSNHYLWVIQRDSYTTDSSTGIYQLEDNDYTIVKKHSYVSLYQPNVQTSSINLNANYVFANNEGTEISVLSKGVSNNTWVIEFIPLK